VPAWHSDTSLIRQPPIPRWPNVIPFKYRQASPQLVFCESATMEIRHLRYFVAVAEALSFTKAALMLHLAQPSLSRQIKTLEEELGVRLLNRTKQMVSLTDEGHSFLVDARRLLDHAREMVE